MNWPLAATLCRDIQARRLAERKKEDGVRKRYRAYNCRSLALHVLTTRWGWARVNPVLLVPTPRFFLTFEHSDCGAYVLLCDIYCAIVQQSFLKYSNRCLCA